MYVKYRILFIKVSQPTTHVLTLSLGSQLFHYPWKVFIQALYCFDIWFWAYFIAVSIREDSKEISTTLSFIKFFDI